MRPEITPAPRQSGRKGIKRICPECDEVFAAKGESRNYSQRFCSRLCAKADSTRQRRAAWPLEQDMRRHVYEEKLSDSKIGEIYGHSYEWARLVRNHYGLKAFPKPAHREIKHGRYIGVAKWNIREKGEETCRACGAGPTGPSVLQRIHLHHVIPKSMCRSTKLDLRNGLPLCYPCHSGWHDRRVTIYRDIFTSEEWEFLITVDLLGQNVVAWLEDNYPARSTQGA